MEIELTSQYLYMYILFYLTRYYLIQIFFSAIHIICWSIMWCPDWFSYKESFGFDIILKIKIKNIISIICIIYIFKIKNN